MSKKKSPFTLTNHLRERYVQRTNKKYQHLDSCRIEQCEECERLREAVKHELATNQPAVDQMIRTRLGQAVENRSYLNNTEYMSSCYEKYGYDRRFQFLVDDDILFVVILERSRKIVVTCMSAKRHFVGRSSRRPKFGHHA